MYHLFAQHVIFISILFIIEIVIKGKSGQQSRFFGLSFMYVTQFPLFCSIRFLPITRLCLHEWLNIVARNLKSGLATLQLIMSYCIVVVIES